MILSSQSQHQHTVSVVVGAAVVWRLGHWEAVLAQAAAGVSWLLQEEDCGEVNFILLL